MRSVERSFHTPEIYKNKRSNATVYPQKPYPLNVNENEFYPYVRSHFSQLHIKNKLYKTAFPQLYIFHCKTFVAIIILVSVNPLR